MHHDVIDFSFRSLAFLISSFDFDFFLVGNATSLLLLVVLDSQVPPPPALSVLVLVLWVQLQREEETVVALRQA